MDLIEGYERSIQDGIDVWMERHDTEYWFLQRIRKSKSRTLTPVEEAFIEIYDYLKWARGQQ